MRGEARPIVGESPAVCGLRAQVARAAMHDAAVLILGESGTGKELVAREIHRLSALPGAFVPVNCAALPAGLVGVELFGHERGAYTGSGPARMGLFEAAEGGTILLDEIGSMPLDQQGTLLRVLEDGEVRRVGSTRAVPVNFRVLSATNVRLSDSIARGTFRADLYYRLSTSLLNVPPLRQRLEDLPGLCRHILERYGTRWLSRPFALTSDALARLSRYDWPGNVRELENVLQQACLAASSGTIDAGDLALPEPACPDEGGTSLMHHERTHIAEALRLTRGNKSRAARLLGISRQTLYEKVERLRIPVPTSERP